ncbi:MAG: RHS repeat-associated core domain-containing protein [Lentimicrobiaceae bacterium]|jgi:hypothetical protein
MNGRMYDPVIGRVLSPDAFVQAPGYTQSYNRYSYCMNNPLKYTDPSGNTFLAKMEGIYDYDGGGFWYRGSYMKNTGSSWVSYSPSFSGGNGGWSAGATPLHYDPTPGSQGYTCVSNNGTYIDIATGDVVPYATVYNNYILPNSYNAQALLDQWRVNYNQQKAYEDNKALAAASNIGYGLMFEGDLGGDLGDGDPPGKYGLAVSAFNAAAAFGLLGIMIDIGAVSDSYGNTSLYLTFGGVVGGGATAGMGVSRLSNNFHLADFGGASQGLMWQLGLGWEVFGNSSETGGMGGIGDKYSGVGANIGIPGTAIYGYYYSYTLLFESPSPDFWIRPGRR